jgi:hypothetical protein
MSTIVDMWQLDMCNATNHTTLSNHILEATNQIFVAYQIIVPAVYATMPSMSENQKEQLWQPKQSGFVELSNNENPILVQEPYPTSAKPYKSTQSARPLRNITVANCIFGGLMLLLIIAGVVLTNMGHTADTDYTMYLMILVLPLIPVVPLFYIWNIVVFIKSLLKHTKMEAAYIISLVFIFVILASYIGVLVFPKVH